MKRFIYGIFAVTVAFFMASCTEDLGTVPGNDAGPSVVVYQYAAARPANPDNDVVIRFATNNKTTALYYLVEKTDDKAAKIASEGVEAYSDYVLKNGVKVEGASGVSNTDIALSDLYGSYTITAVAVGEGNKRSAGETVFVGLDWADVAAGTYYFTVLGDLGLAEAPTVLQVCTTDNTLYRFKDLFGEGYSIKINMLDIQGNDAGGAYQFFRVPAQETPLTYGDYGAIFVRDIGYWQGDDSFVTEGGYESGMYEDGSCFVFVQYYVTAGNLGYDYDYFVPAE